MRIAQLATFLSAAALLMTGCDVARPVSETNSGQCGDCHGFPPAAPHTQIADAKASDCSICHGKTVASDGTIIPGGAHMNGQPDVGHTEGWGDPSQHGFAADAQISLCTQCHGEDYGGSGDAPSCNACHGGTGFADWQTNCTFCHGTRTQSYTAADLLKAAPPEGVHGETATTDLHVGAHQKHLTGGTLSDGVACEECHTVPMDLSHLNGTARVSFGTLATQGTPGAAFSNGSCTSVYCHGATLNGGANTTPSWTGSVACGDCHGSPPATGHHTFHVSQQGILCYSCHTEVAANGLSPAIANTATARSLHVNGQKNAKLSTGTWDPNTGTCSDVACHGGVGTQATW